MINVKLRQSVCLSRINLYTFRNLGKWKELIYMHTDALLHSFLVWPICNEVNELLLKG